MSKKPFNHYEHTDKLPNIPIVKPESGQIAVKVINHFGDEVMKEYKV